MRDWLIALPVWGLQYRQIFAQHCWPALKPILPPSTRFILHTDDPQFASLFADYPVEIRKPSGLDNRHRSFADAHRDAIISARMGEAIAILNADIIVSREVFTAAERRFDAGSKMIVAAATRTVGPLFGNAAPVMFSASALLDWTMIHPHSIVQQCFYPNGKGAVPYGIYFSDGKNIILRAWHLHPFAVLKDRDLNFKGTVDRDLCDNFRPDEIHVVTECDEMALAEVSPPTRRLPLVNGSMEDRYLFEWGRDNASEAHWRFFEKRIVICGSAATACDAPAERVLALYRGRAEAA